LYKVNYIWVLVEVGFDVKKRVPEWMQKLAIRRAYRLGLSLTSAYCAVYGVFELICVDDFSARDMTEPSKT
jgi:hypothetical protein